MRSESHPKPAGARRLPFLAGLLAVLCASAVGIPSASAAEATFYRAINLNGPATRIDGRPWEAQDAPHLSITGNAFENQAVPLKPPTDPARAAMIRSSRWGSKVDLVLTNVPAGAYQIFLYVWEDNHSERFDILVNDRLVEEGFHSGAAGAWKKLGPWPASPTDDRIKISARAASHGAANLSGIEVWSGAGPIPTASRPAFVTTLTPQHLEFFERNVRPLLVDRCYECHSTGAKKIGGSLLLDSRAGIVQGGDTGPAVTPGDPEASLLVQAVRHTDVTLTMPPKKKLAPDEIAALETWVRLGAPDPRTEDTVSTAKAKTAIDWTQARQWWSFRPIADPSPPQVQQEHWPATALDRFILARLEHEGLQPARDADRRTWIRRVSFDLTGLPPAPEDVDAFLADPSPTAFATVVDRLLASPRYGERWGRHWLDVVRYADTAGDNSDFPIPQIYRYRNWVIDAFNRDLPYDQFVREQLAGDLLPAGSDEERQSQVIATGYIANARRFGSRVDDYPQHLTIEDTLDNLGRAFLGLTINCARCHDHKFDPITAADYYGLYGIFQSTRYPWPGIELDQRQRDLVPLVPVAKLAEADAVRAARDAEQHRLQKEIQTLKDSLKNTPEPEKEAVQAKIKSAEKTAADHKRQPLPFDLAYAVAEGPKIGDARIQSKGDPAKPGDTVRRRFLTVLSGAELPESETGSGRRQLANWIAARDNPLAARVMVNRLWLHHFGTGLVPTPNDFGRQGKPPSHPELLDWLASRFIESGWSVKSMHRLILLSRTYRLSSEPTETAAAKDPANQCLSSFPRRRLDAETMRDTLLALSRQLDLKPGGAHPFPHEAEWKFTQHNPFKAVYETPARSVYLMTQRIQRHPYLAIFDGADPSASTAVRSASTTPLQSLYLLNDPFVHRQARDMAGRLVADHPDPAHRLDRAYRLALSRPPQPEELTQSQTFLAAVRRRLEETGTPPNRAETASWEAFVRVLYRLNEFVYLD